MEIHSGGTAMTIRDKAIEILVYIICDIIILVKLEGRPVRVFVNHIYDPTAVTT